jgi:hypothetical protein
MVVREEPVLDALERFLASGLDEVLTRPVAGEAEQRALALFRNRTCAVFRS